MAGLAAAGMDALAEMGAGNEASEWTSMRLIYDKGIGAIIG